MDDFSKKLNQLNQTEVDKFIQDCTKEIAARLLAKVKKRTKPGVYPSGSGKVGGTLRRGWYIGELKKEGTTYKIEVINPVEYAPYVEFGHRKRGGKGRVPGKFMLSISEQDIEKITPALLEKNLAAKLGAWLK